ncbi:MAG TPA: hypothetical protein VFF67_00595 [Thermoplasmata archaeon]|nr:hypothetical protein [Thermoplasmata archaeon]
MEPSGVPPQKTFSPTMRVDANLNDWRAELPPEMPQEERERTLYGRAWEAYLEGDFGFGLWLWYESDRLTNAFGGSVREVTRVVGPGRYFGFSHRRAVAEALPLDRVYRPRKGDMSTPRPEAYVLAHYQLLCVYAVRAKGGDAKAKALYTIALGELEDRRRADPFLRHYETFVRLLERPAAPTTATASAATVAAEAAPADPAPPAAKSPRPTRKRT